MLGISIKWLQNYINKFYRSICFETSSLTSCLNGLILECDELWSFVCSKENPVYIWLALDRNTKQIVGFHLGDRTSKDAQQFWESIPHQYRERAEVYTDFWQSYEKVIPAEKHHPSGKETGETSHIARFNNTLRQRCSRLVRKSLSFSKSFFNHESAILYFINHYNEELKLSFSQENMGNMTGIIETIFLFHKN
jgi:IS1 family transposase